MSGGGNEHPFKKGGEQDCAKLFEETVLNSPNPVVVKKLKPGDILDVITRRAGKTLTLIATYSSEVAGSITSSQMSRIMECIENGTQYVALVKSVTGGSCRVQIRPRA